MRVFRTPAERFRGLPGYAFAPRYCDVAVEDETFQMHYVDEGSGERGVALLVHGMPTWAYLYRRMVPPLAAAGFRCIAPDHIGFGRSDKVLDDSWYTIERHSLALRSLVERLDLERVMLVCQDWGGPIGLRQAADMPRRFERLVIMNTWLHHEGFEYTEAARRWQSLWQAGGPMVELQGCGLVMQTYLASFPRGRAEPLTANEAFFAYEAPFPDRESKAGPRRFPLSIPIDGQNPGVAREGQRCWEALLGWRKPVHFIWGSADQIFSEAWGRQWASHFPQSTFDALDAGHFLQETHGEEIVAILLERIAGERTPVTGR